MKLPHASYICIILALLFYSCAKEDMCGEPAPRGVLANLDSLGLPPATTTGENTFGCLVNGEPWLPLKRNIFGTLSYEIDFSWGTVSPGLFGCNTLQTYDSLAGILSFVVHNMFSEGIYTSSNFSEGGGAFLDDGNHYPGSNYDLDSSYVGTQVEITRLDSMEEIISGTFNLRYIDDDLDVPDTLWITEGRFDLKGN